MDHVSIMLNEQSIEELKESSLCTVIYVQYKNMQNNTLCIFSYMYMLSKSMKYWMGMVTEFKVVVACGVQAGCTGSFFRFGHVVTALGMFGTDDSIMFMPFCL